MLHSSSMAKLCENIEIENHEFAVQIIENHSKSLESKQMLFAIDSIVIVCGASSCCSSRSFLYLFAELDGKSFVTVFEIILTFAVSHAPDKVLE